MVSVARIPCVLEIQVAALLGLDGEGTANTDLQTRNSKEGLAVSELIQYLRRPPRAPNRKDFRKEVLFRFVGQYSTKQTPPQVVLRRGSFHCVGAAVSVGAVVGSVGAEPSSEGRVRMKSVKREACSVVMTHQGSSPSRR